MDNKTLEEGKKNHHDDAQLKKKHAKNNKIKTKAHELNNAQ
jgi:hypothetical protein